MIDSLKLPAKSFTGIRSTAAATGENMRSFLQSIATAALACAMLSPPACAQPSHSYVFVGGPADRSYLDFVDSQAIHQSGAGITAWTLFEINRTTIPGPGVDAWDYSLSQESFNCVAKTQHTSSFAWYVLSGQKVAGANAPNNLFRPVAADSLAESAMNYVCGGAAPFPNAPTENTLGDTIHFARAVMNGGPIDQSPP